MISFFFICNIVFLLAIWLMCFRSQLWNQNIAYQLIVFILPILFGLTVLVIISNTVKLDFIRIHSKYIYIYSSLNLLLLLPQWFKLAWLQLRKVQSKNWHENYKLLFAVFFVVLMIFAMVIFFALYFLLINSISGDTQGLLTAHTGYLPVELDFTTALYFSSVTYFTLGYGDLVPIGSWMRIFVFLECLCSVLNTGLIAVYVYNFLFSQRRDENRKKDSKILLK